MRVQQELLEKPGGMRAVPFGRAGIRHRLDDLVLGRQRRGESFGMRPDLAKRLHRSKARCVVRGAGTSGAGIGFELGSAG